MLTLLTDPTGPRSKDPWAVQMSRKKIQMALIGRYPCVMWTAASTVIFMTAGKVWESTDHLIGQSSRAPNNYYATGKKIITWAYYH